MTSRRGFLGWLAGAAAALFGAEAAGGEGRWVRPVPKIPLDDLAWLRSRIAGLGMPVSFWPLYRQAWVPQQLGFDVGPVDQEQLRDALAEYAAGFQRSLVLTGVAVTESQEGFIAGISGEWYDYCVVARCRPGQRVREYYLGASLQAKGPRPGEDWVRGSDLSDGPLHEGTWRRIEHAIRRCEATGSKYAEQQLADVMEPPPSTACRGCNRSSIACSTSERSRRRMSGRGWRGRGRGRPDSLATRCGLLRLAVLGADAGVRGGEEDLL